MKRVCFLSGDISRSGGTERVTAEITNSLCKLDNKYEIHILSLHKENNENFFILNEKVIENKIFEYKPNYKRDYFKVIKGIKRYIIKKNIDILIDIDSILDIFSIPATRFTKTKFISWEHFNFYENLGVKLRDCGRRLSARYADHILTITKEDLEYFKENLNLKCSISNIYNPVTLNDEESNYNSESKIIVSAGRLTYQKGFDILIDVAREVFEIYDNWKWYILGEGEDRQMLEAKIKKYNLKDKVILKGNVNNIEDYYKEAAIFVLTSRFEGLGMVILEAQKHGLPVVSFECRVGPKEMIQDGVNGYLVDAENVKEMSDRICKLISNDELRKYFSENSSIDLNKFNVNEIVKEWDVLLSRIGG